MYFKGVRQCAIYLLLHPPDSYLVGVGLGIRSRSVRFVLGELGRLFTLRITIITLFLWWSSWASTLEIVTSGFLSCSGSGLSGRASLSSKSRGNCLRPAHLWRRGAELCPRDQRRPPRDQRRPPRHLPRPRLLLGVECAGPVPGTVWVWHCFLSTAQGTSRCLESRSAIRLQHLYM